MKKLASREYGFSVPFCYVTNHPKIEWLKPQTISLLLILWARTLGIGISGQFYMVSAELAGSGPLSHTWGLEVGCWLSAKQDSPDFPGSGWVQRARPRPRTGRSSLSPPISQSQSQGQPTLNRGGGNRLCFFMRGSSRCQLGRLGMAIFADSTTHGDCQWQVAKHWANITENPTAAAFLEQKRLPLESTFYFDSFSSNRWRAF